MYIHHDPDEWTVKTESRTCTACGGDMRKCDGRCNGMASWALVRRDPAEIAKIKAERQRQHEDDVLAEAELIRQRRLLRRQSGNAR